MKVDFLFSTFNYNMRLFVILFLIFCSLGLSAQLKHDANWVFGRNAGINFNDPQTPISFLSEANTYEACASFSDVNGNLLFYLDSADLYTQFLSGYQLMDKSHQPIENGDSILIYESIANGFIVLPLENQIALLHIARFNVQCSTNLCYKLFLTRLKSPGSDDSER